MSKHHLVLLSGLLNDERLWQPQVEGLADIADATVADLTKASTMHDLAQQVLAQAPEGQCVLAGLSMGGYVALEVMRQAPERVKGLVLLDTSARADTPEATENRKKLLRQAETDFPGVLNTLLPKLVHPSQLHEQQLVTVINAMGEGLGIDVFARQQQAIIGRSDSRDSLKHIQCPTLIICGRDDVITPVAVHEEMQVAIPHAELVIIEHCGHLSTLGQPLAVTAVLRKWLATL